MKKYRIKTADGSTIAVSGIESFKKAVDELEYITRSYSGINYVVEEYEDETETK